MVFRTTENSVVFFCNFWFRAFISGNVSNFRVSPRNGIKAAVHRSDNCAIVLKCTYNKIKKLDYIAEKALGIDILQNPM